MQTRAYARALIDNRIPPLDEETVEERVAARMRNVVLQVLPFGRAFGNGLEGPMVLVEGLDHERFAFMEGAFASDLSVEPAVVSRVTERLSMIRTRALDPDESARFIERMVGQP
ncbi:Scr1 family TA system antitoxin-like transcriptional regulator [Streptomyces violaceorubidus]|uniref:Scr1 family TA system antitoxin-like transcriptional regulator n=1 Tax=Streptomyces violaceorubidus TaxID=284042 RepID=A0ABV1SZK6_9ACTN